MYTGLNEAIICPVVFLLSLSLIFEKSTEESMQHDITKPLVPKSIFPNPALGSLIFAYP